MDDHLLIGRAEPAGERARLMWSGVRVMEEGGSSRGSCGLQDHIHAVRDVLSFRSLAV